MLSEYVQRWELTPDGEPIVTATSQLMPVRWRGARAMLKVAVVEEERVGASLMTWWNGDGAQVRVVAEAARLDVDRLLAWVLAWAALSAAFSLEDGTAPDGALRIAELAVAESGR